MASQRAKAEAFRELHRGPEPLVIFNIWDVASAKAVAPHVKAIATSSWAVAEARGYKDGEDVPLALVEDLVTRMVRAVDLPVSLDVEAGYGETPEDAANSVERIIRAGAVGINLEDGLVDGRRALASADAHARKMAAIRKRADDLDMPLFINARTDAFLLKIGDAAACLAEATRRSHLYRDAGADGLFVPGLVDLAAIAALARSTPLPLNIMATDGAPNLTAIAKAGARRISLATSPLTSAMRLLAAGAADTAQNLHYGAFIRP
jgi:2-methylisocitrate lyase-like PEP mutase family enzyme